MLQKLSQKQAECLEAADRCRERADAASDPTAKRYFLEAALHWETIARAHRSNQDLYESLKEFFASRSEPPSDGTS
jgi:hypothetical protein